MRYIMIMVLAFGVLLGGCISDQQFDYQTISAQEAKQMMEEENVLIIDVRSAQEFAQGHIKNAYNIPLDEIAAIETIASEDDTLLIYCQSGNRSARASEQLAGMGYRHVYDFGGIQMWPYEIVK